MKLAQSFIDDAASLSSSSGERRKKKKRRKRKLPKSGCRLLPPGCGRPCDHASDPVHPQTLVLPVATQRQVPTVHSFMFPVQLVDKVLDVPVVVLRQVLRSMVQKTVVVPQLLSIESRRHSFRAAETDPHGPHYSADHRDSPSCCTFQVVDAPVVLVVLAMPRSCRQRQFAPKAGVCWLRWASRCVPLGYALGSGLHKAGIDGDIALHAVFSFPGPGCSSSWPDSCS